MILAPSADEQERAIRRACYRAGCVVRSAARDDEGDTVGQVECPDGWCAARLLLALAIEDSKTPGVIALARELRAKHPTDQAYAVAIRDLVREHVRFQREIGELFQGTAWTLGQGYGDCDDHARAVIALALAGGLPADLALLHHGDGEGPTHALGRLRGVLAETTVAARLGEHPVDAAIRLGLVDARKDLARQVRIMTERDLRPVPPHYLDVNPPRRVQDDAEALRRLGYLDDACSIERADDPRFRDAVADFQLDRHLTVDGLIGPETRRQIGSLLEPDEFGLGYIDAIAPKLTAHLSTLFFQRVEALAANFREMGARVSAFDFLGVWLHESGVGRVMRGNSGLPYYGLNMMHADVLRNLGWPEDPAQFQYVAAHDQIPWVRKYYVSEVRSFLDGEWSKLVGVPGLYVLNFLPAYAKHADDPSYVLTRAPHPFYTANPSLDPDGKGYITVGDLGRVVEREERAQTAYWGELVARQREEGGSAFALPVDVVAGPAGGSFGAAVAVALTIGAGVLAHRIVPMLQKAIA